MTGSLAALSEAAGSSSTAAPPASAPESMIEDIATQPAAAPPEEKTAAQLEWERQMDEAEERQRLEEERERRELEDIRRAEADQRRRRERERVRAEEDQRRESNDRQKLLESLERPLTDLLDKMSLRDELALTLARSGILSLHRLLAMPRTKLAECLGIKDMGAIDRVVVSANRSVALERISALQLPEDEEWEKEAAAKREAEEREAEEVARQAEMGHYAHAGYYASRGRKQDDANKEGDAAQAGPAISRTVAAEDKAPVGPLRKTLLVVVDKWFDYLGTSPTLSDELARAARGERKADEFGGPTWRHTLAWALWMLTTKIPGTAEHDRLGSLSSVASSSTGSLDDSTAIMGRRVIEQFLRLAHEHVWQALYPDLQRIGGAEWRMYWQRVRTSFNAFFSNKGADRWKEAAAADARTAALRAGKSLAEQREAAMQAERLVHAMLRTPLRRTSQSPPTERRPGPPVPTPQGMAASFNLSTERMRAASTSIPIHMAVKQGPAPEGSCASSTSSVDAAMPMTVVAASATWPPSRGQRAAVIAATVVADRYKDTPSRYLDLVSQAGQYKAREGGSTLGSGARWCPPAASRRPAPVSCRATALYHGQPSTRSRSHAHRSGGGGGANAGQRKQGPPRVRSAPVRNVVGRGAKRTGLQL